MLYQLYRPETQQFLEVKTSQDRAGPAARPGRAGGHEVQIRIETRKRQSPALHRLTGVAPWLV